MRTCIRLLAGWATMLGGVIGTLVLSGGWQSAAAGLAILGGILFALSYVSLLVKSERPATGRPAWAEDTARQRRVPLATPAPAAALPRPSTSVPGATQQPRARHPKPAPAAA